MSKYTLPYFNELNLADLEQYDSRKIDFEGRELEIDLNFDEVEIAEKQLHAVTTFLNTLPDLNTKAIQAIRADLGTGETTALYIKTHLDVVGKTESTLSKEEQVLAMLHLARVGFYPEENDDFAIFDYTIGREETNYLVVVVFKRSGDINYLTMES